jgi:hypothetical protein
MAASSPLAEELYKTLYESIKLYHLVKGVWSPSSTLPFLEARKDILISVLVPKLAGKDREQLIANAKSVCLVALITEIKDKNRKLKLAEAKRINSTSMPVISDCEMIANAIINIDSIPKDYIWTDMDNRMLFTIGKNPMDVVDAKTKDRYERYTASRMGAPSVWITPTPNAPLEGGKRKTRKGRKGRKSRRSKVRV